VLLFAACSAKEEIAKLVASAEADKQAAVQQEKAVAEKQVQELKAQLEEVRSFCNLKSVPALYLAAGLPSTWFAVGLARH
jgi:hypothetical protein